MEQGSSVGQNEDIPEAVAVKGALKKEVPTVRRPGSAALVRRSVPTWQQRMKVRAVRANLPKRVRMGSRVGNCESNTRAMGGKKGFHWLTWDGDEANRRAAICC